MHTDRRGNGTGFRAVAVALGVTMAGTMLPTPLYPALQQRYGLDEAMVTVLFAIYAAGVLAGLILLGRASDIVGRRPVLLEGLACAALSDIAFLAGAGVPGLLAGRVLSGLSAGMITGTATATLVEREPSGEHARAGLVATAVNSLGLGCGPLLSGLLAVGGLVPLVSPFVVHVVLVVVAAAAVRLTLESPQVASASSQARRRLRIEWPTLPLQVRGVFPAVSTVMFASFAMFGLVGAIEPAFLTRLLHVTSPLLSGGLVFGMFAGSALSQMLSRRLRPGLALSAGAVVVLVSVVVFAGALLAHSAPLVIASTLAVGVGQGLAFRAAVAIITDRSPADQRAGTMSSLFLVVYLGISAPVVAAGYATSTWPLQTVGIGFAVVVGLILLAALSLAVRTERNLR